MDNKTALALAIIIMAALVGDQVFLGGEMRLQVAEKFVQLIEWVAFWR
ncbi:MAG: hypothetical protein GXP05_05135 [Alphaproteobacteria bacterium]|nr:hypothetical protein [Alphaproteobacteria bacterium]